MLTLPIKKKWLGEGKEREICSVNVNFVETKKS